jgi:hypothetical protein
MNKNVFYKFDFSNYKKYITDFEFLLNHIKMKLCKIP